MRVESYPMNLLLENQPAFASYLRTLKSQALPLYKDKPSAAFAPRKQSRKKVMFIRAALSSLAVYVVYSLLFTNQFPTFTTSSQLWPAAKEEVKQVFLESWHSYENNAWGKDVFKPVTGTGKNMGPKPLGWIIVDSLDTLHLMGCKEEFNRARKWVKDELTYSFDYSVNVFETTIRMLGGLLSAFHLSEDDVFLERAVELANNMRSAFESSLGLPYLSVNLGTGKAKKNHDVLGASSTAEVATLQMEWRYLAKLTGEELYWSPVEKVMEILDKNQPVDGLAPIYVNPETGKFHGSLIRLGSRGDSYYEYLLKQYLQTRNEEDIYWQMYKESLAGVKKHMVGHSKPNGRTFIGELERGLKGPLSPKMDHLVCFYGGLVALGATNGQTLAEARKLPLWTAENEEDFKLGEELTETCYHMYADTPSGLSPEIVVFNMGDESTVDFTIRKADKHNLQRPETVESFYYLYKLTGDEKYRRWGYEVFKSFVAHTRVMGPDGKPTYSCIRDVTGTPNPLDNMESFWLAETLKYLYLLFDDDNKLPLTDYVFNTEAHPFPKFDLKPLFKTGWRRSTTDERLSTKFAPSVGLKIAEKANEPAIDKKNPPKAAPAAKNADEQLVEEIKKDPSIKDDEKKEKLVVEKALKEIENAQDTHA